MGKNGICLKGLFDGTVTDISPLTEEVRKDESSKNVFNISGQIVRHGTTLTEGLPKGIYIIKGKKVMVR